MADSTTTAAGAAESSGSSKVDANTKILKDLGTLREKMDLAKEMLNPGAGTPKLSVKSEAFMAVIGFLEACAPRMIELVEAASMSGVLSEAVFEELLNSNDRLQTVLADIETAALTETPAYTTAASAGGPAAGTNEGSSTDLTDQFGDLLLDEPAAPSSPAAAGAKTTGEEEESDDSKQPASVPASSSVDEFDAFFAERQGP
jgi:hypothetical protein